MSGVPMRKAVMVLLAAGCDAGGGMWADPGSKGCPCMSTLVLMPMPMPMPIIVPAAAVAGGPAAAA